MWQKKKYYRSTKLEIEKGRISQKFIRLLLRLFFVSHYFSLTIMIDILDSISGRLKEEFYCAFIKPFTLAVETDFWDIG